MIIVYGLNDRAQIGGDTPLGVPMLGVAERDFFEADTVAVFGGAHVQVAVDDTVNGVLGVPLAGVMATTPEREAGNAA